MATIRIKRRRTGNAGPGTATLKNAELAFNELDDTLYYGKGLAEGEDESTTGGPTAAEIIPIAGGYIFAVDRNNTWNSNNTFSTDTTFSNNVTVTNKLTAGSLVANNDVVAGAAAYAYGTTEVERKLLATTEYVDTVAGRTSGIPTYPITLRPRLASTGPVGTTETVQGGGTYDYKVAYAGKYVRVAPAADANVCASEDLYFGDGSAMPDSRIVFNDCSPGYSAQNTIVGDNSYLLFLPFSSAEITAQSATTGTALFYGSVKTAGQLTVSAVFDPNNGYQPYSEDQTPHGLGHSISGYQVQDGDRVLVSNAVSLPATDAFGNTISPHEGIWIARSGAWERPADWDSHADYVPFKTVRVTAGDLAGFVFYPKTYYAYNSSLSDAEKFAEITWWRYPTPGLWRVYREAFIGATGDQTWFTFYPEQNVCDAEAWVSQGGLCEGYAEAEGKKFLVAAGDYAGRIFSLSTPNDFYVLPNAQGVYSADLNQPVLSFTETGSTVTTSAWSLSGTNYAIDGVQVALGDVVLLKNETDQTKNGLWVVNAGAWTRHPDYDEWPELRYGSYVSPSSGLNNKDKPFILVTPDQFTIGTSNIIFTPFSQATALSWGAGLQKIGSTVSVKANAATGVVVTEAGVGLSATGGATASGVTWARVSVDQYGRVTSGNSKIVVDTIQIGGTGGLNNANVATWLKDLTISKFLALFTAGEQTGTAGKLVLSTSPTFSTSVVTDSASFNVFNDTATTVSAFGAATTLTVGSSNGNTTLNGNISVGAALSVSVDAGVIAGTNAQAQAALTKDINVITTAAAAPSGVTLPSVSAGRRVIVINSATNLVKVYPASGDKIDALSANTAVDLPGSTQMEFVGTSNSQWYSSMGSAGGNQGGGFAATVTSATAVTLTVSSAYYQFFTGTTAQTVNLPNTTTLSAGRAFEINNNSTQAITVRTANALTTLVTVPAGVVVRVTCTAVASPGTATADWSVDYLGATTATGNGSLVYATSPSLTTPSLGVATATSINKVAFTQPANNATITVADGKTLTVNNTLALNGTDSSTVSFGGGGTVAYTDKNNTFTGTANFSNTTAASSTTNAAVIVAGGLGVNGTVYATTLRGGDIETTNNTISAKNANGSITLAPAGTGSVNVSSKKITSLATPTADNDASTKKYVDDTVSNAVSNANLTQYAAIAANNSMTGANIFTNLNGQRFETASTQDALVVTGRAGGTSSYEITLKPTTLSDDRTITFPDATGTVALTSDFTASSVSLGATNGNTTVNGSLIISQNLTVNGTTTIVNSTTVSIDDPIFTLGGDTAATNADTTKDRGIEFKYYADAAPRVGFFGWDRDENSFTCLLAATNSTEAFSGTAANFKVGSINKVTLTQPANNATITVADTKTLTVNNTLTLNGTDSSTVSFGGGGVVAYTDKDNTFTGTTTFSAESVTAGEFAGVPTLSKTYVTITAAATAGLFVRLPATIAAGRLFVITNATANAVNIQPGSGHQIDDLGLNSPYTVEGYATVALHAADGDSWYSHKIATANIVNDAVTNTKLRNSAARSVIGRSASSSGDPADITANTDGAVLRRSGDTIGFGTIAADGIADGAVATAKLADDAVTTAKIAANAVGTTEIADAAITSGKLAEGLICSEVASCTIDGGTFD